RALRARRCAGSPARWGYAVPEGRGRRTGVGGPAGASRPTIGGARLGDAAPGRPGSLPPGPRGGRGAAVPDPADRPALARGRGRRTRGRGRRVPVQAGRFRRAASAGACGLPRGRVAGPAVGARPRPGSRPGARATTAGTPADLRLVPQGPQRPELLATCRGIPQRVRRGALQPRYLSRLSAGRPGFARRRSGTAWTARTGSVNERRGPRPPVRESFDRCAARTCPGGPAGRGAGKGYVDAGGVCDKKTRDTGTTLRGFVA